MLEVKSGNEVLTICAACFEMPLCISRVPVDKRRDTHINHINLGAGQHGHAELTCY